MKRLLSLIVTLLAFQTLAFTQGPPPSDIAATVTDSDGTVWAGGSWSVTFVPNPAQPSIGIYNVNGIPLPPTILKQSGTLDGTGSFVTPDMTGWWNNVITPVGSMYQISVCPNASSKCGAITVPFNCPSGPCVLNVSSQLTAAIPPVRFNAVAGAYGYNDAEAIITLPQGATYFNVGGQCPRYYNYTTTSWACVSPGGGIVNPGGASNPPVAIYGTTPAAVVNPATQLSTDAATGSQLFTSSPIPTGAPAADIRNPNFAGGAIIDGVSDIGPALAAAAVNACGVTTSTILLPCSGNGCYLNSGTILNPCSGVKSLQLKLQGNLKLGSTLVIPNGVQLICDGGTTPASFVPKGPNCNIQGTNAHGTLGTVINTTGSQSFTPTFTAGTIANTPIGSSVSIIGTVTCTITSITRTTAANQNVTATVSTPCRIPTGTIATVAGVTDTSFNGVPMIASNDYGTGTLTWTQTGTASTSTGGTIVGNDDDTYETVDITGVTGGTITACCFRHNHATTDVWGAVGVEFLTSTYIAHNIQGLNVNGAYGAEIRLRHNAEVLLDGVGSTAIAWASSIPLEISSSFGWHISNGSFQTAYQFACKFNCTQTGYPRGIRITSIGDQTINDGSNLNGIIDSNTFIVGGIKIDTNGNNTTAGLNKVGDLRLQNVTIEQPAGSAIELDPRYIGPQTNRTISMYNLMLQDNFVGYIVCLVNYTDPSSSGSLVVNTLNATNLNGCIRNKYNGSDLVVNGVDYTQGSLNYPLYVGKTGVLNDGRLLMGENIQGGAGLSASVIPFASSPVVTNPTSWSCVGTGCTINTNALAPDGTLTAGELVTGSAVNPWITVYNRNGITSSGDVIIAGVWCMPGQGATHPCNSETGFGAYWISSNNVADTFDFTGIAHTSPVMYVSNFVGLPWSPLIGMHLLNTGTGVSHTISMQLFGSSTVGHSLLYWQPFFFYIPYASKPTSWTDLQWYTELSRWREFLLHNTVPPNWNTIGTATTIAPIASLPPKTSIAGTSGIATCSMSFQGNEKYSSCNLAAYAQTGTAQTYIFPVAYTATPILLFGSGTTATCGTFNPTVTNTTLTLPANAAMLAETCQIIVIGQ